jgi:acyl carrier protein
MIMMSDKTDVLALPVSWEQFARSFKNAAPPRAFLRLLPKTAGSCTTEMRPVIGEELLALEPARRRAALEVHLREQLGAVLKTGPGRIDPAKPFGAMGMDSLMGLEFVRRLSSTTRLRLPVTAVFNYPTIQSLAREIAIRMGIALESSAPVLSRPNGGAAALPSSSLAGMTDEEAIEALIGGKPAL